MHIFTLTYGAGFIGSHLRERLPDDGRGVIYPDNYALRSVQTALKPAA